MVHASIRKTHEHLRDTINNHHRIFYQHGPCVYTLDAYLATYADALSNSLSIEWNLHSGNTLRKGIEIRLGFVNKY